MMPTTRLKANDGRTFHDRTIQLRQRMFDERSKLLAVESSITYRLRKLLIGDGVHVRSDDRTLHEFVAGMLNTVSLRL